MSEKVAHRRATALETVARLKIVDEMTLVSATSAVDTFNTPREDLVVAERIEAALLTLSSQFVADIWRHRYVGDGPQVT